MPYLYVYSPSDFVSGLPIESGAQAYGTGPFTLTLVAGATPTLIEVTDDDLIFDEVDGSQVLTNTVTIDGETYSSGTSINTAYDLTNSSTGHQVTSLHFGGDGYQQGAVDGLVSTVPLVGGTTYTFDQERTSHTQNNLYDDFVACFTADTLIETNRGFVCVEDLSPGDMVLTLDNDFQPLRLILKRTISANELADRPTLRPVRLSAGALGQGLPKRDLLVSPQHRFLTNSPIAKRMFGETEVLVSATKLTALPGIWVDASSKEVDYFHLVMDRHEIVYAENAPTESYFFGPMALRALAPDVHDEIKTLFPDIQSPDFTPNQARPIPSNKQQKQFAHRHEKNGKSILAASLGNM